MDEKNLKGFVRLSVSQKAQLIRQAYVLFNDGQVDSAGRIFITVDHTAGILQVADFFWKKKLFAQALSYYRYRPTESNYWAKLESVVASVRTLLET